MAVAKTTVTAVPGYTTSMGNRGAGARKVAWDTGTYPAGGLSVNRQGFGLRGFDFGVGGITVGGNYNAVIQNPAVGGSTLKVRLLVLATGVEVATGAALTADSVLVFAVGG